MPPSPPASDGARDRLLDAILPHVPFDGWSDKALANACADIGTTPADAHVLCPRGAIDLAVALHRRGDIAMLAAIESADLTEMRLRDRIALALRARIAATSEKEAVRRATSLFALPQNATEGAALIWSTADAIWTALGDRSDDFNWYSKRVTLSGVYGAVVLYWLGDTSEGAKATDTFIDRRIAEVMQFEKFKASVNANPLLKPLTDPLSRLLSGIKAPGQQRKDDLPGRWTLPQ